MSLPSGRMSIFKDPALAAMGLLPVRYAAGTGVSADSPSAKTWRLAWCLLAIGLLSAGVLFWPTVAQMIRVWDNSETFNHCYLIFPICGYLIWLKREALANVTPRPSLVGLGVIAVASVGWLLGEVGSVAMVQQFSLIFLLQGLFLAVLGLTAARLLIFPLAYMLLAVPVGEFLVPILQDITAVFVVKGLRLIDIPVFLDGVFISIPTGNFEVAEACSGLRFLIATIALGFLFAHLTYKSRTRQIIFIALCIVVPVIANGFRAFGIVLLAYFSNNKIAVGVDHIVYGWVFFSFITIILLAIGMTFRDGGPSPVKVGADAERAAGRVLSSHGRILCVGIAAILLSAASPAYAAYIAARSAPPSPGALPAPEAANGWRVDPTLAAEWSPAYPAAHALLRQSYRKGDARVDLFIAYYTSQRQGAELIGEHNRLTDGQTYYRAESGAKVATVEGAPMSVYRLRILGRGKRNRIAYRWYWVGGQITANRYYAKMLQAVHKLVSSRDPSAAIIVSATYDENPQDAETVLQDFVRSVKPISPLLQHVSREHAN